MPASAVARRDDIAIALRTLGDEQRRLDRLGLELPLARCHEELRYWGFLAALHALPDSDRGSPRRGGA
jgi:hypothetical protein